MTDNRQPTTNKEVYFFMNNLTTRKIVLGILMALALVFSVQGIAEAQTVVSGDHQTKKRGDTFSITFKADSTMTEAPTADPVTTGYALPTATGVTITSHTADRISITKDSNYALSYRVNLDANPGLIMLGSFNIYIVPEVSTTVGDSVSPTGHTTGYWSGQGNIQIDAFFTPAGVNVPRRYSVSGGGSLYVDDGSTNGSSISSSQNIDGRAPVWLRMNRRTNVVSVYVAGHNSTKPEKVTFIYGLPRIQKMSGDSKKQLGAAQSKLGKPFVVEVNDTEGNPVRGQIVTFTVGGDAALTAHPDFPDDTTANNIPVGDPQTTIVKAYP